MVRRYRTTILALAPALFAAALIGTATPSAVGAEHQSGSSPILLAAGLQGGAGSTVGPDGALYVTETLAGRVSRVDPGTGAVSTLADGLPGQLAAIGLGGPMDVAFIGHTAYVLETLVGPDVGGSSTVGIYRIDGPHSFTVVADIGTWSTDHPPGGFPFFVPSGVQYAMQPYGHGFLVTDGHHNRVLNVSLDGQISEFKTFGDIVPTGLATRGHTVYMAEAGPIPHLPGNGKIVSFDDGSPTTQVAAGGRLLVDVEFSHGNNLYALAQGYWNNTDPGTPAQPDTGQLLQANHDGSFSVVAQNLDRPTSLEFIDHDAYVITLTGQIWKLNHIKHVPPPTAATLLASGLQGGAGSTVGPDGALYVTETLAGRVSRVDPGTGAVSTLADGLPGQLAAIGLGGPMDVAFIGHTAYVLETLVGPDVGGSSTVGIYRIDGPHSFTVVADIGTWSTDHPPGGFPFFVPSGVQYAMQPYGHGFLVTDGHHNRVLNVSLDGQISEFKTFGDIVPTGLATRGHTVYMAEAGPIPHLPGNGKIVSFDDGSPTTQVAAGGRLLVDVEFSHGNNLYALAQGYWNNTDPGTPAQPDTGQLLQANHDGSFSVVAQNLDRPTSLEFIDHDAYVITLTGQIWKLNHIKHVPD